MPKLGSVKATSPLNDAISKFAKLRSSKEVVNAPSCVLLTGPTCHGKTTTALSISEQFPAGQKFPLKDVVKLTDTIFLTFDVGALDSLPTAGLEVEYMDLSGVDAELIVEVTVESLRIIREEIIPQGEVKNVIIDGLANLARIIGAHRGGDKEGTQLWGAVLRDHTKVFNAIRSLPCDVVITCAGKDAAAEVDKKIKAKKEASGRADFIKVLALQGQAQDYYRDNMSYIIPCFKEGSSYNLYPYGVHGWEFKCRPHGLSEKEPADLKALMSKLRKLSTRK